MHRQSTCSIIPHLPLLLDGVLFFACPSCGGYVSILYRLMHMVAGEACPMRDPRKYQDYIDLFQFSRPKSNSSFTDFNQQENSF